MKLYNVTLMVSMVVLAESEWEAQEIANEQSTDFLDRATYSVDAVDNADEIPSDWKMSSPLAAEPVEELCEEFV